MCLKILSCAVVAKGFFTGQWVFIHSFTMCCFSYFVKISKTILNEIKFLIFSIWFPLSISNHKSSV